MYPEQDMALDFWHFVYTNARDPRLDDMGEAKEHFSLINHDRETVRHERYVEQIDTIVTHTSEEAASLFDPFELDEDGHRLIYPTVQHALLGYLVELASKSVFRPNHLLGPLSYERWLRVVAVVMADAARDPERLTIMVSETVSRVAPTTPHTLTISSDWTILLESTFDYIRAHHTPESPVA